MKLNQLTSKEIEALKGECLECNGEGEIDDVELDDLGISDFDYYMRCPNCSGTGLATIEIEKEAERCLQCNGSGTMGDGEHYADCDNCLGEGKISKYKVGDEIKYCLTTKEIINIFKKKRRLKDCDIKLKIITETENTWTMAMKK